MAKSAKPSGLSFRRDDQAFCCSWKIPSGGYADGQEFQYATSFGGWKGVSPKIDNGDTSKMVPLYRADFYPTAGKKKTISFTFRVRGNQGAKKGVNPTMSDWSSYRFEIKKPKTPTVTATVSTYPSTKFAWNVAKKNNDEFFYSRVSYESILVKDSNETDGAKAFRLRNVGTKYTGTPGSNNSSVTITEDSAQLADGHSYTRWFRIKSQGFAGDSPWVYSKHVYALSNQCTITNFEATESEDAQGYVVKVWYDSPWSVSRPIGNIKVQYAYAVPDYGMSCPDGASWQDAKTVLKRTDANKNPDTTGGVVFSTDSLLTSDQCLFVRVNSVYDNATTYGVPVVVDVGKLTPPSGLNVSADDVTYRATVSADNDSAVPDSFLVVRYFTEDDPNGIDIGIIPHGSTSVVVQCPEWTAAPSFGVYAVVGDYIENDGDVKRYDVNAQMQSDIVRHGGSIPNAPTIAAYPVQPSGTIRVTWDWSWDDADSAELSWADHADAWESTAQPTTFTVSKMRASAWNISDLQTGVTWYVRVRLVNGDGEDATYGTYSQIATVNLASAPLVPVLELSDPVITESGQVTATWVYSTTDGTGQAFAELAEQIEDEDNPGEYIYNTLAQVQTAQHATLYADELGWVSGDAHDLVVKVVSESGRESDGWSLPKTVYVAEPPTCEITATSLTEGTITTTDEAGDPATINVTALDDLPLEVTVEGAGDSGITTLSIERAASYHVDRPDETDYNGFEGETIYTDSFTGEGTFTIELEDLIGKLDDGANYRIIATVQDALGQSATAETLVLDDDTETEDTEFTVLWNHQPDAPTANVVIDRNDMIAIMSATAPDGAALTDVCDIYRLSADKPELIYKGAEFGEYYVDPFPTIGRYGGYRFVTRTATGDYISDNTPDGNFAWTDILEQLQTRFNIIDFGTGRAFLEYDFNTSSSWSKDFQETKYLGGSIQGDWNKPVSRTGSISFKAVADKDIELIETMRRLAAFPGICHVRTKDGSSYPANVEVSETYNSASGVKTYDYSLSITRVDQEDLDGMTAEQWNDLHGESE